MSDTNKKTNSRDADFLPSVGEIIAARAGFRCSFLNCDESTIGAGTGPNDVERKGVAAHIFAASSGKNAPRGTGGLSAEARSQAANGIWLCQDHSRIVDNDKGKNYPAAELQAWKSLHESRIAQEVRKVPGPSQGWLERVTFESNPIFLSGQEIVFGKVTLLLGANGTGKTAFCEWLSACAGESGNLIRWSGINDRARDVKLRLSLLLPSQTEYEMHFRGHDAAHQFDGRPVMDLSHALRVIYMRGELYELKAEDDAEYLARVWGIHLYQVAAIVKSLASSKYGMIKQAELREEEDEEDDDEPVAVPDAIRELRKGRKPMRLYAMIGAHESLFPLRGLSGRERSQIIVSGAMIIAERQSLHHNTILILELAGHLLPDELLSLYAEKFQSGDFRFQTLLVNHSERPNVDWTGWSVARFSAKPPRVRIEQNRINDETGNRKAAPAS
jgi:hypothetical protein